MRCREGTKSAVTKKRKDPNVLGTLPELVALARRDVAAAKRALAASAGFSQKALTKTASKALDAAVAVAARLPVIDVDARIVDGELASMDGELASERVTVEALLAGAGVETSFSENVFGKRFSGKREPTSRRTTRPARCAPCTRRSSRRAGGSCSATARRTSSSRCVASRSETKRA